MADITLAKRPFVTLTPTSDGAEIIISIENMGEFDRIEYELTYQADNPTAIGTKIQRGATGTDVNPKDEKYKKSILLGTASKGTRSPDRGISDGMLAFHGFKGEQEFLSETKWDIFQVGAKKQTIEHQTVRIDVPLLQKEYWMIMANTIGVPPKHDFDVKKVSLPVIGAYSIASDFPTAGKITINTNDVDSPELYAYYLQDSSWKKIDTTYNSQNKTLSGNITHFATFVTVSSK